MIKLVEWDEVIDGKDRAEWFIELGRLDKIDREIIRGRRDGKYQFEVANNVNVSVETIKNRTNKLIEKYKRLIKSYPKYLSLKKEYTDTVAIVSIITDDQIYNTTFNHENFDSFDEIYQEVIKRIETQYNVKVDNLGPYRVSYSGTYIRNKKD